MLKSQTQLLLHQHVPLLTSKYSVPSLKGSESDDRHIGAGKLVPPLLGCHGVDIKYYRRA